MGDDEVEEISSNKAMMLAESRVRCIIDNAKCILKASIEEPTHLVTYFLQVHGIQIID